LSHGLGITEITRHDAFEADEDSSPGAHVTQPVEPAHKLVGLSNFEHPGSVASWLRKVNDPELNKSWCLVWLAAGTD
jgi:hypothetical protein